MIEHVRTALVTVFVAGACFLARLTVSDPIEPGNFSWRKLAYNLPASVQVYEGRASGPGDEAFQAWYASIDYSDLNIAVKPFLARDTETGRELPSRQAARAKALVAVNGGYFDVEKRPAETYSLVMHDGHLLRENKSVITRGGRRYFAPRSAMGITKDRRFEIGWAFHAAGKLWKLPRAAPVVLHPNQSIPNQALAAYRERREWNTVENAIGGGPRLVKNGKVHITFSEEIFTGSGFQNAANYARTAVGWTRGNRLILLVVDGRQPGHSLGLTLTQLARVLISLGCVEAINLDGGGSSAFVVNGRLLNLPSDGRERATTSILAVVSSKAQ